MSGPKILALDIETLPATAYVWRLHDEDIPLDRLIEPGRIACAAWGWYGKRGTRFAAEWHRGGRRQMLKQIRAALAEADAVVTFNGDHFDLPRLNGEFVLERIPPAPPITSIDLYKTVRKLGLQSGKLAFVGPYLGIGEKVKHEGFGLWRSVMAGDGRSRARMERYNRGDVRLTLDLYARLRPYITAHPYLSTTGKGSCPACGSKHLQARGNRRTRAMVIQRLHCQACGAWSDGTRRKA